MPDHSDLTITVMHHSDIVNYFSVVTTRSLQVSRQGQRGNLAFRRRLEFKF